jgi:hypothetical protein
MCCVYARKFCDHTAVFHGIVPCDAPFRVLFIIQRENLVRVFIRRFTNATIAPKY